MSSVPWSELAEVHARLDALQHSFYLRWTDGTLTRGELADYSGQYRHAVVALADASDGAAAAAPPQLREGLQRHAAEERSHVELWDGFAREMGGDTLAPANPETRACATAWAGDGGRPLVLTLAALHAIECVQPKIAATKRSGLVKRYGVKPGAATAYFDLHEHLDVDHADAARTLLDELATEDNREAIVAETERVLGGYLQLLDGVEASAVNR